MKRLIKTPFIIIAYSLIFGFIGLGYSQAEASEGDTGLQDIHGELFDAFFPENEAIAISVGEPREQFEQALFAAAMANPEMIQALQLFGHMSDQVSVNNPDVTTEDVLNTLLSSGDPNLTRLANLLRKMYLFYIYSHDAINAMGGVELMPELLDEDMPVKPYLIESQLSYANGEISRKDGALIDYLIIGTGPAASVIAYWLVQNEAVNVVMVERGALVTPGTTVTQFHPDLMEKRNMWSTEDGLVMIRAGRAVGGGTAVNVDLAFSPESPAVQEKIKQWVAEESIFPQALDKDQRIKKLTETYQWVTDMIGTRKVDPSEVNVNNQLLLGGSPNADTYSLNSKRLDLGEQGTGKISALDVFLWPMLGNEFIPGHLSIIPNTEAVKITYTGNTAQGVVVKKLPDKGMKHEIRDPNHLGLADGQEAFIKAKKIIVAAGAIGSAELLLRSGIPNDNIGKGLIMHPSMGVAGVFKDKEVNMTKGLSTSVYASASEPNQGKYFFEAMAAEPNFVALSHPGKGVEILETIVDYPHVGGFGVMLVDSVSPGNKVYLDENGALQVAYQLSEQDKDNFRAGLLEAAQILFDQGANYILLPSLEYTVLGQSAFITNMNEAQNIINNLQFIPGLTLLSSAHAQATNKMGNSPETAVVSQRLKVWNQKTGEPFTNLYVVDSSVFPTSVGLNPMQSIYVLAKLFTDLHLAEQHRQEADAAEALWNKVQKDVSRLHDLIEVKSSMEAFILSALAYDYYNPEALNVPNDKGEPPLIAAIKEGLEGYAEVLLHCRGVDINRPDSNNVTPLMQAADQGDLKIIQLLVDKGANIYAKDDQGNTVMDHLVIGLLAGHSFDKCLQAANDIYARAKEEGKLALLYGPGNVQDLSPSEYLLLRLVRETLSRGVVKEEEVL